MPGPRLLVRALLIYWAAFCGLALWMGRPPDTGDQPYPLRGVLAACVVLAFETAILYQAVAPRAGEDWKKRIGLVALFAASLAILGSTAFKAENPPYFHVYAMYAVVTLAGLAAWGAFIGLKCLRRGGAAKEQAFGLPLPVDKNKGEEEP